jgi:single-strand DNA-binding protein
MDLNRVILVGRVTADIELKSTGAGQSVARMGIATNRKWTDKEGGKKEEVEFHNVVLWGKTAEVASQFLKKGSLVLVEGRLQTRNWTDKAGVERKATEIVCESLQLGPRPESNGQPN